MARSAERATDEGRPVRGDPDAPVQRPGDALALAEAMAARAYLPDRGLATALHLPHDGSLRGTSLGGGLCSDRFLLARRHVDVLVAGHTLGSLEGLAATLRGLR